ncbi:MAG TPA: hypothetical protein VHU77_03135 [Candidatus Limnocylindria bacterium]|nr:hypothetical protein [Candidatus Limnocylindria bacterium]
MPANQRGGDKGEVRREEQARYDKVDDVLGDLAQDRLRDEKDEKDEHENANDALEGRA